MIDLEVEDSKVIINHSSRYHQEIYSIRNDPMILDLIQAMITHLPTTLIIKTGKERGIDGGKELLKKIVIHNFKILIPIWQLLEYFNVHSLRHIRTF